MMRARNIKPAAGFLAAALLLFSVAVHSPFLHSYLHGHAHSESRDSFSHSEDHSGHAHDPHSSKPCETCNSCRAQNHFSFHLSAMLHFCPAMQHAETDVPQDFQTRPVFFLTQSLFGRAPPVFSF